MTSPEESALHQAIVADPDADGPRLAYADWLARRGDPRGEFIRVDIEMTGMKEDDPRYAALDARRGELLEAHQEDWAQPLRDLGLSMSFYGRTMIFFERGLIETVWVDAPGVFPEQAAQLFALCPGLREVSFQSEDPLDLAALAACPYLARLRSLDLSSREPREEQLRAFLASPYLGGLRSLDLGFNELGDEGMAVVGLGGLPPNLEHLGLRYNRFGEACARALAGLNLPNLRSLELSNNPFGPEGLVHLLGSSLFHRLRTLKLESTDLGPEGVELLVERADFPDLVELDLGSNEMGPDGAIALARWPGLKSMETLNVAGNEIEDEGLEALVNASSAALTRLELLNNDLGAASAAPAGAWAALATVTELGLNSNRLGDAGLEALAGSPHLARLSILRLYENRLGPRTARALVSSAHFAQLTELDLRENPLEQAGAEALAAGAWPKLQNLHISALRVGEEGEVLLEQRFGEVVHLD